MIFIYGRQKLLSWFDTLPEDFKYFSIYRRGKVDSGNVVFTNVKDGEREPVKEDTRQRLEQYLNVLNGGEFEIVVNNKVLLTTKGRAETTFAITQNEGVTQQPVQGIGNIGGGIPEGYISKAEAAEIAQKKFEELMLKKENDDLKAKVAALEKDNKEFDRKLKSPWQEVISGLAPYAPGILKSIGLVPEPLANVAGINANTTLPNNTDMQTQNQSAQEADVIELTPEQQQQATQVITDFVNHLATVFPDDYLSILQRLTATLQTNPGKIKTALQFL